MLAAALADRSATTLAAMRLRRTDAGLIVDDREHERWVSLPAAAAAAPAAELTAETTTDMLAFLAAGEPAREAARAALAAVADDPAASADPAAAGLPFQPRSLRAFMTWESHAVQSARMLVKNFFPAPVARTMGGFERLTGRTFPPLKPKRQFHQTPPFYLGNHTAMLADGERVRWPHYTEYLDFELELAYVLARPIADATPEQAKAAIGGWLVFNDWSARDVQADEVRHNVFGPVVKSKSFANSLGCDLLTADELPDWQALTGRVRVDGELWCEGKTDGAAHDVGAMLAHACASEQLGVGDLISTGTIPGCCGLEHDRWLRPGQTVELEIDAIGKLANTVAG